MLRTRTMVVWLALITSAAACGDDREGEGGAGRDGGGRADAGAAGSDADAGSDAGAVHDVDRSDLTDAGLTAALDYADPALWVCRPDNDPNECERDLDATEISSDGTQRLVPYQPAADPAFDCFYVYPTVLLDGSPQMIDFSNVDVVLDPLLSQAARFGRVCTIYAPLYRQTGLIAGMDAGGDMTIAIEDVRDAFEYFIDHLSGGRDFVLIGHSQGSFMLAAMMRADIDSDETLRARMISALLLGGDAHVAAGERTGGSFENIPTCADPGETGCVIAYASFDAAAPPTDTARFGLAPEGMEAACVNPGPLAGNGGRYRGSYFPTMLINPTFAEGTIAPEGVTTPFVLYRDTFSGECVQRDGFSYLEITLDVDSDDERSMAPYRNTTVESLGFGLHLVDYNVALDDLIDAVEQQAENM